MADARIRPETVAAFAEQLGFGALPTEVATMQALDVEARVRLIVQEALKFMRHGRRQVLSCEDVNHALRLRNVEPLYGYVGTPPPPAYLSVDGFPGMCALADRMVDLKQETDPAARPLPKLPVETLLTSHWLAVQGVQPTIPENGALGTTAEGALVPAAPAAGAAGASVVVPVVAHVVSKELHLLFDRVTGMVLSFGAEGPPETFATLAHDGGLQPLAPYFTQWFAKQVTEHLGDTGRLRALVRAASCLLANPALSLEAYLHQLMPALITCLVARKLGRRSEKAAAAAAAAAPASAVEKAKLAQASEEDHWDVRDAAAGVLAQVCARHGASYPEVQPRICRTLLNALLDPARGACTHYGALVGLERLVGRTVRLLVLPSATRVLRQLPSPQGGDKAAVRERAEAERLRGALLRACGTAAAQWLAERAAPRAAAASAAAPAGHDADEKQSKEPPPPPPPPSSIPLPTHHAREGGREEEVAAPPAKRARQEDGAGRGGAAGAGHAAGCEPFRAERLGEASAPAAGYVSVWHGWAVGGEDAKPHRGCKLPAPCSCQLPMRPAGVYTGGGEPSGDASAPPPAPVEGTEHSEAQMWALLSSLVESFGDPFLNFIAQPADSLIAGDREVLQALKREREASSLGRPALLAEQALGLGEAVGRQRLACLTRMWAPSATV